MRLYLADTSVAIPFVFESHDAHAGVNSSIGRRRLHLAGHAAVETFAVLTRLPGDARVLPDDALTLLRERFAGAIQLQVDLLEAIALVASGISGGAVYDGLVALAALSQPGSTLYSRDIRASGTYARLGVNFELL